MSKNKCCYCSEDLEFYPKVKIENYLEKCKSMKWLREYCSSICMKKDIEYNNGR